MKGLFLAFLLSLPIAGAADPDSTQVDSAFSADAIPFREDSTMADSSVKADTVLFRPEQILSGHPSVTDPEDREQRLSQNPTVALFKSMLVPGLGQMGNRSYYKAVLFIGLDAWFIGAAIHYGRQASDFRGKYEAAVEVSLRNDYYSLYENRKGERNKFTWFAVITTFISMFDAYVDAHLSGFPRKEDNSHRLSFRVKPDDDGRAIASISLSF